jgi:AbrB family looped-hinge helix DNA binding protein
MLHGGGEMTVTVHHRTYARPGRERRGDVQLLCWGCHRGADWWRHRRAGRSGVAELGVSWSDRRAATFTFLRGWDSCCSWYGVAMSHKEYEVVVGDRGRMVLPAAVRLRLGLGPGTRMLLSTEPDGSLLLKPYRVVADQGRGLLAGLAPGGGSLVDDLVAERRDEAERENNER